MSNEFPAFAEQKSSVYAKLSHEGHGITEIFIAVGHTAAIEANVVRMRSHILDLIKHPHAGQDAQMPFMVALAEFFLFHTILLFNLTPALS